MELIHFVTVIINATSEIFKKIYYISNVYAVPGFILAVKAFLVRPLPMPVTWLGFSVCTSFLRGDTQHMMTYENFNYYRTMTSSNYNWSNCN
ncbi:hypothetical protein H8356DRAFT_1425913 [Neocallimastix lanati (nom. inval.)]|nr:hypothetical protein H8356DRAFT_1425913 [Neocallimastix sp. JGI-2020a]